MPDRSPRDLLTEGHKRKFLVIVDESPEGETTLYYAAHRARRTGGGLALLFVIEQPEMTHWLGVMDTFRDERHQKARAVFRLRARKLKNWGFEDIAHEEIIREGYMAEEIAKLIEEDRDFGILVARRIDRSRWSGAARILSCGRCEGRPIPHSRSPSSPEISRSKRSKD